MMASPRPSDTPPPVVEAAPPPAERQPAVLEASNFIVGFDWVLSVGVLALAFLAVSFAVRNADFWQHLAAGRLIAEGGYSFGKDPFSFVSESRPWVNHAWLFDLMTFWIFKAVGGPGVVVVKGLFVVMTAGLLLAARRPGQAVWGSVVCVGLAVLASAPRLMLQPTLASYFFLSVLLCVLIRAPRFLRGTKLSVLVGVVCCLWANSDQWFFLGPVALALYTLGAFLRPDVGDDQARRKELLTALGVGVLACNVGPHHVMVWALPPELVSGDLAGLLGADAEFAGAFRGPFSSGALDFGWDRGNPLSLYALVTLLTLGVIGLAGSYRRLSAPLLLVLAGFVALALLRLRGIPFLAFVAAPILAVHLTDFVQRLADRPMAEGVVRLVGTGRLVGRIVLGIAGLGLLAASYPGWLHPFAEQRRWKWDVEPNASMVQAAENLQRLRADGSLPAGAKLLNLQPDFACYVAWFAPAEKTFFDHRLAFHAPEAADYAAVRRLLYTRDPKKAADYDLPEFLGRHKITHVVSAPANIAAQLTVLGRLWQLDGRQESEFAILAIHGRAVTLGRAQDGTLTKDQLAALRFDPRKAAFAQSAPTPTPAPDVPAPNRDLADSFLAPPPAAPAEAEEAFVLKVYHDVLDEGLLARSRVNSFVAQFVIEQLARRVGPHPYLRALAQAAAQLPPAIPLEDRAESIASGILAARAARRAVAASPNHPDGYAMLAMTYPAASAAASPDLAKFVAEANRARAVSRLPADARPGRSILSWANQALALRQAHLDPQPQRLDMAVRANRTLVTILRADLEDRSAAPAGGAAADQDAVEDLQRELDRREKELGQLEQLAKKQSDKVANETARLTEPLDRATLARREGLAQEALEELLKANDLFQKKLADLDANPGKGRPTEAEYGAHLALVGDLVELLLYAGRAEEAVAILGSADDDPAALAGLTPATREAYARARFSAARLLNPQNPQPAPYDTDPPARFRVLRVLAGLVTGDYGRAVEAQREETRRARENLKAFTAAVFPNGLPPAKEGVVTIHPQMDLPLQLLAHPAAGFQAAMTWQAKFLNETTVGNYRSLLGIQSDRHVQLGLTCLEMGDAAGARGQFREVLKAAEMPPTAGARRIAKEMLTLLGE